MFTCLFISDCPRADEKCADVPKGTKSIKWTYCPKVLKGENAVTIPVMESFSYEMTSAMMSKSKMRKWLFKIKRFFIYNFTMTSNKRKESIARCIIFFWGAVLSSILVTLGIKIPIAGIGMLVVLAILVIVWSTVWAFHNLG